MPPESPKATAETGLVIRSGTGLVALPNGRFPALSEIITRSLVHIRTSKALAVHERQPGEECEFEIANGVMMRMCWIPPGEFLMGSPENELGRRYSETQRLVRITRGFWMGKYLVTQAQWEGVMGTNPSLFKGANLPVEWLSWTDIAESGGFMEKANCFGTAGGVFSLPTEAQWEYACRAGTTTALNNGKNLTTEGGGACPNLDEVAWYEENSDGTTHPVGQKKGNTWGLHDMHGNVCEWCADWFDDYPPGPLADPRGSNSGSYRVVRGGCWEGDAYGCRAAYRGNDFPTNGFDGIGFRIARSSVP